MPISNVGMDDGQRLLAAPALSNIAIHDPCKHLSLACEPVGVKVAAVRRWRTACLLDYRTQYAAGEARPGSFASEFCQGQNLSDVASVLQTVDS